MKFNLHCEIRIKRRETDLTITRGDGTCGGRQGEWSPTARAFVRQVNGNVAMYKEERSPDLGHEVPLTGRRPAVLCDWCGPHQIRPGSELLSALISEPDKPFLFINYPVCGILL